jgi:hypothetical protein
MLVPALCTFDGNFRFAGAVTGPAHALRRQQARTAASTDDAVRHDETYR